MGSKYTKIRIAASRERVIVATIVSFSPPPAEEQLLAKFEGPLQVGGKRGEKKGRKGQGKCRDGITPPK